MVTNFVEKGLNLLVCRVKFVVQRNLVRIVKRGGDGRRT